MNEETKTENANPREITLYICNENGKEICRFVPPATKQAFRTIKKGLPGGFYIYEGEDGNKLLYSDDIIIPLDRGSSPDIIVDNGEPCIVDGDGRKHFFNMPFEEFKKKLLLAARNRYKDCYVYYQKEEKEDGDAVYTDIMMAKTRDRKLIIKFLDAKEVYEISQYGGDVESLLYAMDEEIKAGFLSPMEYMTDPKYIWNFYKDMIVPEVCSKRPERDFEIYGKYLREEKDYYVRFLVENRKDITEKSSFYLTPSHVKKMNVDGETLYEQSVQNLERRLKELGLYPEKDSLLFDIYMDSIDDFPGSFAIEEYALHTVDNHYWQGILCLPQAKKYLEETYPDGYKIGVYNAVVAYPTNFHYDEEYLKRREQERIESKAYFEKLIAEEERQKAEQEKLQRKGLLEKMFHKKRMSYI